MKLISKELPEVLKTVKLCEGIEFDVKQEINYIYVDADGFVFASRAIPFICGKFWVVLQDGSDPEYLGKVDLDGMDWRETAVEV